MFSYYVANSRATSGNERRKKRGQGSKGPQLAFSCLHSPSQVFLTLGPSEPISVSFGDTFTFYINVKRKWTSEPLESLRYRINTAQDRTLLLSIWAKMNKVGKSEFYPTESFVTPVQTTEPLSLQTRSLWPRSEPEPVWVGLVVTGSHRILDGDSTMAHSMFLLRSTMSCSLTTPCRGVEGEITRGSPWNRLTLTPSSSYTFQYATSFTL